MKFKRTRPALAARCTLTRLPFAARQTINWLDTNTQACHKSNAPRRKARRKEAVERGSGQGSRRRASARAEQGKRATLCCRVAAERIPEAARTEVRKTKRYNTTRSEEAPRSIGCLLRGCALSISPLSPVCRATSLSLVLAATLLFFLSFWFQFRVIPEVGKPAEEANENAGRESRRKSRKSASEAHPGPSKRALGVVCARRARRAAEVGGRGRIALTIAGTGGVAAKNEVLAGGTEEGGRETAL